MTKRLLILFILLGVSLSSYLATAPAHATSYLWGLNIDGTPAAQPSVPPDSKLVSPYAGPNLGLTTSQFDTYASTILPAGSYWGPVSFNYGSGPSNYVYYGAVGGGFGMTNWLIAASYSSATGFFTTCTQQSGAIVIGGSPVQGGGYPPGTTCGENRPSASLSATPSTINLGETSTLFGTSAYVTSCSIDHGIGNVGTSFIWLPVTPTVTTTYTMTCQTSGAPVSASATVTVIGSAVNGTCGSANGTTVSSAPSSGLCSVGTASSVSGSGPWNWTCAGSGSGTTASCSAFKQATPDLTAGSITPTTATVGTAVTLSSTISNSGNAATGAGFTDLFQSATDSSGTGAANIGTYSSAAIAASGSNTASLSYTFPSAGTTYVRACADSGGVITESNESNNCGAWTAITVGPGAPPPPTGLTYSCNAAGNQVTLSWNASPGATNYYVRNQEVISGVANYVDGVVPTTYTYNIIPNTQYGWWIHSNVGAADYNPAHYSAASFGANFSCGGQPDLTAGTISPTSATVGTPVSLYATIANGGTGATGAPFYDLFQRATDSSGSGATDISTFRSGVPNGFPANYSEPNANVSYTFPSAATWYVRACADKSSAGNAGVITESNESNNCGAWTAVSVAAAVPSTLSCTASATSVTIPGSVTYTASGASAPYTWTASDNVGSYGTASTASRNYTVAGNYGMTVSKGGYTSGNCPVVAAGVAPSCSGTAATISASPNRIRANQPTTLTYSASQVNTSCTISGPGVSQTISATSCSIPGNGGTIGVPANTITTQATYTITCDGTVYPPAIVNVVPAFQEF
ncbi:hypothetical protein BH11PAT2_BH11PAT2_08240 [soil metagenome]